MPRGLIAFVACAGCGRLGFDDIAIAPPDAPGDAAIVANRAFVSSSRHGGDFGGSIANMDAVCQGLADTAGLGGTFIALASTTPGDPRDRLLGARGWQDVTGVPIVDQPNDWFDGHMLHPLLRDERGAQSLCSARIGGPNGDCEGWTTNALTSSSGIVLTARSFRFGTTHECPGGDSLICVEADRDVAIMPTATPGRIAFVTTSTWLPGGGLAAADAVCGDEATTAALPGTYKALLSTATQDAFARFSITGLPWTRPDGIAIAPTAALVTTTTLLDAHAAFDATGVPLTTSTNVWTGDSIDNCNDWTSAAAGQSARVGVADSVLVAEWRSFNLALCNAASLHLVCLQE